MIGYGLLFYEQFDEALSSVPYKESHDNLSEFRDVVSLLETLLIDYRNETYIGKGLSLTDDMISVARQEIVRGQNFELDALNASYDNWIYEAKQVNNQKEVDRLVAEKKERFARIEDKTQVALDDVERILIQKELQRFKDLKFKLSKLGGFEYAVTNGFGDSLETIDDQQDIKGFFEQLPNAIEINEGAMNLVGTTSYSAWKSGLPSSLKGYVGQTQVTYASKEAEYLYVRQNGRYAIAGITIGLLVVVLSVGLFIGVVGRSNKMEGVVLTIWDRPYLDIMTIPVVGSIIALMSGILYLGQNIYPFDYDGFLYLSAGFVVIGTLVGYYWLRLFVKRVKRRELLKHTFVFQILKFVFGGFFERFRLLIEAVRKGPASKRLVYEGILYTVALGFAFISIPIFVRLFSVVGLVFSAALFLSISLYAFQYRYKAIKSLIEIKEGVARLASGNLDFRIDTKFFDPENRAFAESIHNIADGFNIAVENEVKAERMKAELVTNVSHDLKTPLTSLIAYVDLLKKEELGSEQAKGYLEVVDQKVERLRILIEDLFEAAKASSGTLQVQSEVMDFAELLTQGLGEISEQINASGLDFRIQIAEKPLYVLADGKLLWRVVENLVSNVLKYSLPQSRVYVQLSAVADEVQLIIKNISSHELNMPASELTERFKRGDEARHSEGSGLGLSIAKSLAELMHGKFLIEVDGDLFKATLSFKKAVGPAAEVKEINEVKSEVYDSKEVKSEVAPEVLVKSE
jgi:signal transduction histidine kinase